MRQAPNIFLSGQIVRIPGGNAGTFQTVRAMRQLVDTFKTSLLIRNTAASIAFLTPEKNQLAEVNALYSWVRDSIRYLRDIHNVETLASPEITLQTAQGDCDDQATLLATLLESIGYPTRFVMASYLDPNRFEHVYLSVYVNDQWIDLDPTENYTLGQCPPDAVRVWYE